MPSNRFLERASRVLESRAADRIRGEHRALHRIIGMGIGIFAAAGLFFVLKGAALASGADLGSGDEGLAFWIGGSDPISSAFGAAFQSAFAART